MLWRRLIGSRETEVESATLEIGALFVVAFPVAAGDFFPYVISPAVAATAMSGSSALVAVNALLLKRTRLDGVSRAHPAEPGTDRPEEATA